MKIRAIISFGGSVTVLVLLAAHFFGGVELGVYALGLIAVGFLIWLLPSIRSVKFPGGFEVEFHNEEGTTEEKADAATKPARRSLKR